nr:tegument protein pp65 [Mastomys natalensis cytomegalovirus 3]WEG70049.1 tegument protein pp65 [Mastomys natalensis cytomegalovirus 3]WEG70189.1 tegument protein pp65 [Mastomys natalensis cytomegalovirus 3]WEG70749.1 tegument protein pp65 [Mastomys natalensis cytomegalovirus 3]
MNRTILINPRDARSPALAQYVNVLMAQMFVPRMKKGEIMQLHTGMTVLLKKPSVLCVCDDAYMSSEHSEETKETNTCFYVVDSTHGVGDLIVPVRANVPIKPHANNNNKHEARFSLFAITLSPVSILPLTLSTVNSIPSAIKKVSTRASISISTSRSGKKSVKVTIPNLKWTASQTNDFKHAVVHFDLPENRIHYAGFDIKTSSEPHIQIFESVIIRESSTVYITLRYNVEYGTPPDKTTLLLSLIKRKRHVNMTKTLEPTWKPLFMNGFVVKLPKSIYLPEGQTLYIQNDATYTSESHGAIFLPYLVKNIDVFAATWAPNTRLSITVLATKDITLSEGTPLGELRFIPTSQMTLEKHRNTVTAASQFSVSALGPEMYRRWKIGIRAADDKEMVREMMMVRNRLLRHRQEETDDEDDEDDVISDDNMSLPDTPNPELTAIDPDPSVPTNQIPWVSNAAVTEEDIMYDDDEPEYEDYEDSQDDNNEIIYNNEDVNRDGERDANDATENLSDQAASGDEADGAFSEYEPASSEDELQDNDPQAARQAARQHAIIGIQESMRRYREGLDPNSDLARELRGSSFSIERHYRRNRRGEFTPFSTPDINSAVRGIKLRRRDIKRKEELHGERYNETLKLTLTPLGVTILTDGLAPVLIKLPASSYHPDKKAFRYTLIARDVQVVRLSELLGTLH